LPDYLACRVAAALECELGQRRMESTLAVGKRGHIPDREYLGMARKAQVGLDDRASARCLGDAEVFG
jgi:hypothetical protein